MSEIIAYKCSGCTAVKTDPEDILRFEGNVVVPGMGGMIGGNIFTGKVDKAESSRGYVQMSDDKSLRITYLDYCKSCVKRILKV